MSLLVNILAIISIAFCIQNIGGPFGVLSKIKNWLLNNKYLGVFFFELFECPYCIGFHAGYFVYLLTYSSFIIQEMVLWGFIGAFVSYISFIIINKLNSED